MQKNPSSQSRGGYDGLTVEVTGGKVRGKTLEGGDIDAWLGIPYADKPIGLNLYYSFGEATCAIQTYLKCLGDLRFQRPAPVRPWEGVLNATEQPNACQQVLLFLIEIKHIYKTFVTFLLQS